MPRRPTRRPEQEPSHRVGDPRRSSDPAARHRPGRDAGVAAVLRRDARRPRPGLGPLRDAAPAGTGPREAGRRAGAALLHRLHQHHPAGARAVVPRRRGDRAPDPRVHPLERRSDGVLGQPQGSRGRRPHRHLPALREPLRGRLQPLLPRQGPRRRRRPDLHPGPRLAGCLRPRVPRGELERGELYRFRQQVEHAGVPACRRTPTRGSMPDFGSSRLCPMGLTAINSIYQARFNRYMDNRGIKDTSQAARVGLHGRRRDGRARVARRDPRRRARGARQPGPGSSTATCSSSTARSRATARSSRSSRPTSAVPAGTSSRSSGAGSGTPCSRATSTAPWSTG